jgi:hypothetical protein
MMKVVPKLSPNVDLSMAFGYNKMHRGYRVEVDWGIGGLKSEWKKLMKKV